jgi:hypothetical protein
MAGTDLIGQGLIEGPLGEDQSEDAGGHTTSAATWFRGLPPE